MFYPDDIYQYVFQMSRLIDTNFFSLDEHIDRYHYVYQINRLVEINSYVFQMTRLIRICMGFFGISRLIELYSLLAGEINRDLSHLSGSSLRDICKV